MSHFKLKATIGGEEVVDESLNLKGSKIFKVFPVSRNDNTDPIRSSAIVNISGKKYTVDLRHEGHSGEDPEPSAAKWSYIIPIYSTGDTAITGDSVKNQKYAYIKASCGKTEYINNQPSRTYILSKPYNTQEGLIETVGDFSGNHYGRVIPENQTVLIFRFRMYYKYLTEQEGQIVTPTDDGSPESNKARIPAKPEASVAPSWVRNSSIQYVVQYEKYDSGTSGSYTSGSRDFYTWEDFISFWDLISISAEYHDAKFHYTYVGFIEINNETTQRGFSTITFDEIDNGKGIGIHGVKSLYLKIAQQEGFINYHLGCISATNSMFTSVGQNYNRWSFPGNQVFSFDDLRSNKLTEYNDDDYGFYCKYTPEFKLTSGRLPDNVYTGRGYNLEVESTGFTLAYQYVGKPIVLGAYVETPSVLQLVDIVPYYLSTDPTDWLSRNSNILGDQVLDPLDRLGGQSVNDLIFRHDGKGKGIYGTINGKHWMFKLMPLCIFYRHLTSLELLELYYAGLDINEVDYFNSGKSGVVSGEYISRGLYSYYGSSANERSPEYNNIPTLMGRSWEQDSYPINARQVAQMIMLPVMLTDFHFEHNPTLFDNQDVIGRLYFSPKNLDGTQVPYETALSQIVIGKPSITIV